MILKGCDGFVGKVSEKGFCGVLVGVEMRWKGKSTEMMESSVRVKKQQVSLAYWVLPR